jgi:hypothetical protein
MTLDEFLSAGSEAGYQRYWIVYCYSKKIPFDDEPVSMADYINWIQWKNREFRISTGATDYDRGSDVKFFAWLKDHVEKGGSDGMQELR